MSISQRNESPRILSVPGGTLVFDVHGDVNSPLVVLLHGMGDRRQAYSDLTRHLVEAGYRVAAVDMRGHGESSVGWPEVTQSAIGHDAAALVRELGGPAAVIGHSFTPDSAVVAALDVPESVRAVVALSPWASAPEPNWVMRQALRLATSIPAAWGLFLRSLYATRTPATRAHRAGAVKALRRHGGTAALQQMADPASKDALTLRSQLSVPALVIMGSNDPDFSDPGAEAEAYASGFAKVSDIVLIEGAGHYPHVEQPGAVAESIIGFLNQAGLSGATRA